MVAPKISPPLKFNAPSRVPKTSGGLRYNPPHKKDDSKNKGKAHKKKKNKNIIRGKEITIRDSASPAQIIYGETRVGGITTMVHTTSNIAAYIQTGDVSTNNALLWTVRVAGGDGNAYTLEIVNPGASNPTTTCSFTPIGAAGAFVITLATNGAAVPTSTLNQVISSVQATSSINIINVQKSFAGTNGVVGVLSVTNFANGGGYVLHQIITLAGHEIDSVQKLYLDDYEVAFGASPDSRWSTGRYSISGGPYVFMAVNYGADDQPAQPDCVGQIPDVWTIDHIQAGCAHVYLILRYNNTLFPDGLPEIQFLVRGKKCYNPATLVTEWTTNAALILNDYLTNNRYGVGLTNINQASLLTAITDCAAGSPRTAAPDEQRYVMNGSFDATEGGESILSEMEQAMAGKVCTRDGEIHILPGVWRSPTITITQDDLRGEIRVNTHVSRSERFNCARGTYVSTVDYQETDIPPQKNSTYISEDGGIEIYEDFPVNFVISPTQAQRILKIELEKVRQGISVSAPLKLSGLLVAVGDTCYLTLPRYGWSAKTFEVMSSEIVIEDGGVVGVDLELRETASGVYDWSLGNETTIDLATNTTLPDATDVEDPSNIIVTSGTAELYLRGDGTVQSRMKVTWTPSTAQFVASGGRYQIRYKLFSDVTGTWIATREEPDFASFHYILDVTDGAVYIIQVRALNSLGYGSNWIGTDPHTVVGKTAPPLNVSGFTANITNLGVALSWQKNTDFDLAGYRIKRGTSTNWAAATIIENLITATNHLDNFRKTGSWYYLIKAVDTSGNESTTVTSFLITVVVPNTVASLSARVTNNIILIDWDEPSSTTFPIAKYKVYKGATFGASTLLGTAFVTFQAWTEDFAGSSSFWVTAVDIGGNESAAISTPATWFDPPNTIQYNYSVLDVTAANLSSAIIDESYSKSFIAPVRVGDSFEQHFTRNNWATFFDQCIGFQAATIRAIPGLTTWYTSNDGVAVTALNQVSQWNDQSGNAYNATQATVANQPYLSRADNQENRILQSETFETTWARAGLHASTPVVANVLANPIDGALTADQLVENNALAQHYLYQTAVSATSGQQHIISVYAKSNGRDIQIQSATIASMTVTVNLATGAVTSSSGADSVAVDTLANGWFRINITDTATATSAAGVVYVFAATPGTTTISYTGDNSSGVYLYGFQFRGSATASTYLATTTFPQYAGINGNRAMHLDGTNDALTTALAVNPTGGVWGACAFKTNSLSIVQRILTAQSGSSNSRFAFYIDTSGRLNFLIANGSANFLQARSTGGDFVINTNYVVTFTYDGNTSFSGLKIYKNGVALILSDTGSGVYTVPTAGTVLDIGGPYSSQYFNGYLPEVIFGQGSTISDTNRQAVESYLAKYTTGPYAKFEPVIWADRGFIDDFTDNSWATIQDKIDAGNSIWIEPSDTQPAYFTSSVVDIGATLNASRVQVSYTNTEVDPSCTVETYISTSPNNNTWTTYAEGKTAIASDFRYVKMQIKITGADTTSLVRIGDPTIVVGVRQISKSGRATTSALGTVTVNIGTEWLSLNSIQITDIGGSDRKVYPVFNYSTISPTTFDALGYIAGTLGIVDFSWTVEGAVGEL